MGHWSRVRVAQRGEGTLLYIGKMPSQSQKFPSDIWYGVDLDGPRSRHNGSFSGQVYFYCLENCGAFVQAAQLGMADMLQEELVMKALLNGEDVLDAEVSSLRNRELELFLARKYVVIKKNLRKDILVAKVLEYVARKDTETVHGVPLQDEGTQEEQSECVQSF